MDGRTFDYGTYWVNLMELIWKTMSKNWVDKSFIWKIKWNIIFSLK